jgi:hypothetical protein
MATIDLLFDGKTFPVPNSSVAALVEHKKLSKATNYAVHSSVPAEVFEAFVHSVKNQTKISITPGNAVSLWLLAKEFFLLDVTEECASVPVSVEHFAPLSERVSKLERQISFASSLSCDVEKEQLEVKSDLSTAPKPENPLKTAEFRKTDKYNCRGIISYLTEKHEGNVDEKGIVAITSKSIYGDYLGYSPHKVADFGGWPPSRFLSKNEPHQWVCWDFREMRIRPTNYRIQTRGLKSWVLEGSLDGENWTEMDRQTENGDFDEHRRDGQEASFVVWNQAKSRFIRLTQTDQNRFLQDHLLLIDVEFFGTLFE